MIILPATESNKRSFLSLIYTLNLTHKPLSFACSNHW